MRLIFSFQSQAEQSFGLFVIDSLTYSSVLPGFLYFISCFVLVPLGFLILTLIRFPYYFSQAFAQAGKDIGCIFRNKGDIDLEKIKQSRYFRSLFPESCERTAYGLVSFAGSLNVCFTC